jgi:uncharacterized spore protein YtfJ
MMDVRELTSRIGDNLSVRRAFGAAYERDGLLVIPVALVAGGGGGGQGPIPVPDGSAPPSPSGIADAVSTGDQTGVGGGFGGLIMPIGAYVVKDDQVRWVPAVNTTLIAIAGLATIRVLARVWSRRRRG